MSNFEAKNFFKVYLAQSSYQRMRIPTAAVVCSNKFMPATATFRNCKGQCWHVEVNKCNGKMFFKKGWRRFIEENSIKEKDFLVFSYDGCSVFDVRVLGYKCLKSVSHLVPEKQQILVEEGEMSEEQDDDDDDDYQEEGEDSELELEEEESEEEVLDTFNKRRGQKEINKSNSGWHEGFAAINDEGATFVEVEDEELCPERYVQPFNPYFVAKTKPERRNELRVPINIIKDYDLILEKEITFLDPNGQRKIGKVRKWKDGRTCIRGWRGFCERNKVDLQHDVCICEFLLEKEQDEYGQKSKFIKVHIKRGGKDSKSQKPSIKKTKRKHTN